MDEVHSVMCCSFLNLTVKTVLKSIDFDEVTGNSKLAPFLWPTAVTKAAGC